MAGRCLELQEMVELGSELLPAEERLARREHLRACEVCSERILSLVEAGREAGSRGESDTLVRDRAASIAAGWSAPAKIGRYQLQEELGAGGMGRVFAAFDPRLERRVALKVVHPELVSADPAFQTRLLREARSAARLAHPNVVAVHDSGTLGDEVYVAMELVEGPDLSTWLEQEERSLAEILEVFVQAGRGLAAAHRAGLVHRDFKPANVLVGDDGRVRVSDFGLATIAGPALEEDTGSRRVRASGVSVETPPDAEALFTRTGALVGTPGYIAPELLGGARATALSDQFSFCVSLYEALHGARPFCLDRLEAVATGAPLPPPGEEKRRLPPWLRRLLTTGLQLDPEERFPSMSALLVALDQGPRRRRQRRLILASAIFSLTLTLATFAGVRAYRASQCRGGGEELAGSWSAERRQALEAAFAAEGSPWAAAVGRRVLERLERYASDWKSGHQAACRATRIEGAQSDELLTLRMACLRQSRRSLELTLGGLLAGGEGWVARAEPAIVGLPDLRHCADVDRLRAALPPPADEALAARVEELRDALLALQARLRSGESEAALAEAEGRVEEARSLGYPPLVAEALLFRGEALEAAARYEDAGAVLEEAALLAQGAGDDLRAARATLLRTGTLIERDRLEEAEQALRYARASVERLGEVTPERADLASTEGSLLARQGRFGEAVEHHRRALELARAAGANPLTLADLEQDLGNALERSGSVEEAVKIFEGVAAAIRRELGEDHPRLALALASLGRAQHHNGQAKLARETLEAAVAIYERTGGERTLGAAIALNSLANIAFADLELERAEALYRRILEIVSEVHGPEHSMTADMIHNLAGVHRKAKRYAEALAGYEQARAIYEKLYGDPDHPTLASVYVNIGTTHEAAGDLDAAITAYSRGLAIREKAFGPESPRLLSALIGLSDAKNKKKDFEGALAHSRRALAIVEKSRSPDHADLIFPLHSLGTIYGALKRYREAIEALSRALALSEVALGPDHPRHIYQLQAIGEAHLGLGEHAEALAVSERAARLAREAPADFDPTVLADAEFVHARALWPQKVQRKRARALALHAAERYVALGQTEHEEYRKMLSWLSSHPEGARGSSP
ncbi:MAG: serine/threonine-protein kinase [Deltaproteobacteria bacterium]|nr:serine/threonine-protein kinase [Deltaproteobacteria bacterium]